ncbi:hypothetical protein T06_7852, partial [Trichinella sp. T6]
LDRRSRPHTTGDEAKVVVDLYPHVDSYGQPLPCFILVTAASCDLSDMSISPCRIISRIRWIANAPMRRLTTGWPELPLQSLRRHGSIRGGVSGRRYS